MEVEAGAGTGASWGEEKEGRFLVMHASGSTLLTCAEHGASAARRNMNERMERSRTVHRYAPGL